MGPAKKAFAYVGAFVDELVRAGVRHVCVSPGSRSTPLALTIAANRALRIWTHIDERSGAFFALGLARSLQEPVALLCTSGTAAANFLPAIVEAKNSGVPLLVLTADRPPELRDVGAAQTIDQNRLFGAHVKWFVDVALPDEAPDLLRYVRTLACRAAAHAKATPPGPVHLNFPFREPLVPAPIAAPHGLSPADKSAWTGRADGAPWVRVEDSPPAISEAAATALAEKLNAAERALIVCGPQPDSSLAAPLAALAKSLGAPLLVDPLSQVRWGAHDRDPLIDRYDATLRDYPIADLLLPDFILRIGAIPTSKTLNEYLKRQSGAPLVVVDPARWPDPSLLATEIIHADPRIVCETLLPMIEPGGAQRSLVWLQRWNDVNSTAGAALDRHICALDETFEGRTLNDVVASLPETATLFVSSSMPVRDLDAFGAGDARSIRVLSNRGANGIDGVVSSAMGAAAANRETGAGPLVLVIGDLALYHDMNGLLAAKLHSLDATIVVINNDGGGIFSFLPEAAHDEHFEKLFGTPHGLDFERVAELYDAVYQRANDSASLRQAVANGASGTGLHIVEIRTDRTRNVELHHDAWAAVAADLDSL
ncbi:MAG: 2-succinyl-5-enolpyruvyl-6-hydroxy-3-cyclohexene-1-carboxylic-acid synthase [Gemmatimonadaceae bacterium]